MTISSKFCSYQDGHQAKIEKRGDEIKKKFFFETTEPISTKLY
jgi:hypothetical protein